MQRGSTVHDHRALAHRLLQCIERCGHTLLDHLHRVHRCVVPLHQLAHHKRRIHIPRHVHRHPDLVQPQLSTGNNDSSSHSVHRRPQHLRGERRALGTRAEGPLQQALHRLVLQLHVLWVVQPHQFLPLRVKLRVRVGDVLSGQSFFLCLAQVVPCVQQLRIQVVAVRDHCETAVLCDRAELGRQHRNPVQHVVLRRNAVVAHLGNGYIALQRSVLLGGTRILELYERLLCFLLQVDLCQRLFHLCCVGDAIDSGSALSDCLKVLVGHAQEACKRLLHDRVRERTVKLDVAPVHAVRAEDVLSEESAIDGSEVLLLICVCGLELPVACHVVHVLRGECEQRDALFGSADVESGGLEVCEELFVHEGLARDDRYLTCAYGAPEVGVGLAAYELGVLREEVEGVVSDQTTGLQSAQTL